MQWNIKQMAIRLTILAVCVVFTASCGTSTGERVVSGALLGAGAGAGIGALAGGAGVAPGAAIGGAVGAVGGAVTEADDFDMGTSSFWH